MDQLYLALEFVLLGAALAAVGGWLIFRRRAPQPLGRTARPAAAPEAASAPAVARPEPPRTDARFAAAAAAIRPAADTARLVEAVARETGIEHALVARVVAAALARNTGAAPPQRRPPPLESLLAATAEAVAPSDPPDATARAPAPAPLIMVVDDSITVRVFAQRLLKAAGYRVVLAEDGLDALERLKDERPSVVLADIEMPRMDGFDLARHIRADGAMAHMPIIVITSRIAHKHREYARQIGVNHYLGKPYAPEELIQLVRRYAVAGSAVAA